MLEPAYFYQNELNDCMKKVSMNKDLYFYFMYPTKFYSILLDNNESDSLQYVSKDSKGNILGYFAAYIGHDDNHIKNLDMINFSNSINIVFSKDAIKFLDKIFLEKKFRKVIFYTIADNPAVKIYRKLIKKFNGREVGCLKNEKLLTDGTYHDEIIFEIFLCDYIKNTKKRSALI